MLARLEIFGKGMGAVAVDDPRFAATQAAIMKDLETRNIRSAASAPGPRAPTARGESPTSGRSSKAGQPRSNGCGGEPTGPGHIFSPFSNETATIGPSGTITCPRHGRRTEAPARSNYCMVARRVPDFRNAFDPRPRFGAGRRRSRLGAQPSAASEPRTNRQFPIPRLAARFRHAAGQQRQIDVKLKPCFLGSGRASLPGTSRANRLLLESGAEQSFVTVPKQ